MKKLGSVLLLAGLLIPFAAQPSYADPDDHHGQEHRDHGAEHHIDHGRGVVRHVQIHDHGRWEQGHWWHGVHDGRHGWWWLSAGGWFFYPRPVYPYPQPYYVPPATVIAPPPISGYWYCPYPAGYYPYVPECYTAWTQVPGP